MSWIILVVAGLFEVGWAVGLKSSEGFTRFWPSVWTVLMLLTSLWLLSVALRTLPLGTAYAVWVGIGAVGTVIVGIVVFNEPATTWRVVSVTLIVAGIIGIKLSTSSAERPQQYQTSAGDTTLRVQERV